MTSKEIKNLLKEARESIKNKDFQTAIKKCNDVIKYDKKNHMAYVFLGAANQESNKKEAYKNLKIALELSEDKSLALQGLANCAEPKEIPDIIKQLLVLFPDKFSEYYSKLFNASGQNLEICAEILANEVNLDVQQERIDLALHYLLKILFNTKKLAEKYPDQYLSALKYGLKDRQNINHLEFYQIFFKLLYQRGKFDTLLTEAEEMIDVYQTNLIPFEWICKVFVDKFLDQSFNVHGLLAKKLEDHIEKLLNLNPESALGLAASGLSKYSAGDFVGARNDLLKVYNLQPTWNNCAKILGICYMKLRAYLLAELIFKKCKDCNLELAESLVEQQSFEKVQEGLKLCREVFGNISQDQQLPIMLLICKGLIYSKQFENARKSFEKVKSLEAGEEDLKLLEAKLLRWQEKFEEAKEILEKVEEKSHEILMELGAIHFQLKNYDESLMEVLKATKLEPHNSECFFMLGKIYVSSKDEVRSKKCFEKCLSLNPQNEKAITLLSSIYRKNNEWDSNLTLLENSVNSVTGINQRTAFAQLGYHHLAQRNYDDAITAFRSFLRYDSSDLGVWEGLAEAYMNRGSYNSAMNVFERAVELSGGENLYARLQIGKIKFITQFFQESITEYEELLSKKPDYLPALKGIAESHFGRAKYLLEKRRVGRAWDHCQESLKYLEKAIKIQSNILCLWRSLGNLLDFVACLPPKFCKLMVPGIFFPETNEPKELKNEELMEMAAKCYSHCLKISQDDEFVWYELSRNFYVRAVKFAKDQNKVDLLKLAFNSCKHLLKLSGSRWQNWNLLGMICMSPETSNPALVQHAFMQALNLDKKLYTCWSNLGVFYLQQGDISLANKAFSKAQQFDTGFLNGWIGQAFIAELNGLKDESMDLFRHCTSLGFHLESSLGYSNFVCSVLSESGYWKIPKFEYAIDKMNAVPLALDSMTWHCQAVDDEATFEALAYLGYLNGRQGLWKQAVGWYQKALVKCDGLKKDKCLTDLGYCFLKIDAVKEAVKCFGSVGEATFSSSIGLALAHFRAKNYEDSYSTYQSAVEWLAQSDEEKSSVLVAMAGMVYAFQGDKDAKILLFQCIGLPNPPPEALFSLCAISLLHSDKQLSDLTIKELQKFEADEKYCHHVIFLVSQFYLKNFDKKKAFEYVLSKIHIYPDRPHVRKVFVDLVMEDYKRNNKKMRKGAGKMAQSTIVLRLKDTKQKLTSEEAAKTLAIACEAVRSADPKLCKLLAQKAVHMNPTYRELLQVCQ